ncbi:MAG: FHA domain-containing protein [Desulfobacterales bacterium]|nr:FHA domain-containing protein [Desulfobacterales bacterium]
MTKLWVFEPQTDTNFQIKEGVTSIGRSPENDIVTKDRTVSGTHLSIRRSGNKYFITDLKSENGTFFDGNVLDPFVETEIREGVPIAIGMTVICLGAGCVDQIKPYLDFIGITKEPREEEGLFAECKAKTNQKKLQLLYRVSGALAGNVPVREALETILDNVFQLLKRIDRGAFILIDPETGKINEVICRASNPDEKSPLVFCMDVVNRVIREKKALAISNVLTAEDQDIADTLKLSKIQSVICVPLTSNSQTVGVIYLDSLKRPCGFRNDDLFLFSDLCERTALFVISARIASEFDSIADDLVGSPPPI